MSNPTTTTGTTDGTRAELVLTCTKCGTTFEPPTDNPWSCECPTDGCGGYVVHAQHADVLTAWHADIDSEPVPELVYADTAAQQLANAVADAEPESPQTVTAVEHLPSCHCPADEREWCSVSTGELHFVPDYADDESGCSVQVERLFPEDDDYTPESETLVAIEPDSGELHYRLRFHPSQLAALIEGLRAALELLAVRSIR